MKKHLKVSNPIIFECWYMAAIEIFNNKFIEIDICLTGLLTIEDFMSAEFNKYNPEIYKINLN
jgi:hypothetical protein